MFGSPPDNAQRVRRVKANRALSALCQLPLRVIADRALSYYDDDVELHVLGCGLTY